MNIKKEGLHPHFPKMAKTSSIIQTRAVRIIMLTFCLMDQILV